MRSRKRIFYWVLSFVLSACLGVATGFLLADVLPAFLMQFVPSIPFWLTLSLSIIAGIITILSTWSLIQKLLVKNNLLFLFSKVAQPSHKQQFKRLLTYLIMMIPMFALGIYMFHVSSAWQLALMSAVFIAFMFTFMRSPTWTFAVFASLYASYGMFFELQSHLLSLFPTSSPIGTFALHAVVMLSSIAVFLLTFQCVFKMLNKMEGLRQRFHDNEKPIKIRLTYALSILVFLMGLYLLLGPLVLSAWVRLPMWSYALVASLLGVMVLGGFIYATVKQFQALKRSGKGHASKSPWRVILDFIDRVIASLCLVLHAFGGEGSIAAKGVQTSKVGGSLNSILAFLCLLIKALVEIFVDINSVIDFKPMKRYQGHGLRAKEAFRDGKRVFILSRYDGQLKGSLAQSSIPFKAQEASSEGHDHNPKLATKAFAFLSSCVDVKKRPARVVFFWLGLATSVGLGYVASVHVFQGQAFGIGVCVLFGIMLWGRLTKIGDMVDQAIEKKPIVNIKQKILKTVVSLFSLVTAASWGLLGGAEFVHVMHAPVMIGLVIAMVGMIIERSFYQDHSVKVFQMLKNDLSKSKNAISMCAPKLVSSYGFHRLRKEYDLQAFESEDCGHLTAG